MSSCGQAVGVTLTQARHPALYQGDAPPAFYSSNLSAQDGSMFSKKSRGCKLYWGLAFICYLEASADAWSCPSFELARMQCMGYRAMVSQCMRHSCDILVLSNRSRNTRYG